MKRRTFIQCGIGSALATPLLAAVRAGGMEQAVQVLKSATAKGQIRSAALLVREEGIEIAKAFGKATTVDAVFLLASITKPMSIAAVMTLYDKGEFKLDDPVKKFVPEFTGDGRAKITMRHLMTHASGLPDQLPENQKLRQGHAPLSEFIKHAIRVPLLFPTGTKYSYSSMAILLATEVARRISGQEILDFVNESVFKPLEMKHSALGLGKFQLDDVERCQVASAAPESGSGDPKAKAWDWNSLYWRKFGAPWGGAHASVLDVSTFLGEFMNPSGRLFKPETARLMLQNHNPRGIRPRGLGFGIGVIAGSPGCSEQTFGHTGSTGTLAWADPKSDRKCIVLTTLPGSAANPHPRKVVSDLVAKAGD